MVVIIRDVGGKFMVGTKTRLGIHLTEEHKKKISEGNKGKAAPPSSFKKGHIPWITGIGHSEETRRKMSESQKKLNKRGSRSSRWKGGVFVKGNGYIYRYCPDHPHSSYGYYAEHRLVMEKVLGRFLDKNEHVHHINGKRDDNRIENLVVLSGSEHNRQHPEHQFKKGHPYHRHK